MAEFVTVGKADEVGEGEAKSFAVKDEEIAVSRLNGSLYAFNDICTHRGCNLSMGGDIEGTTITCECHGSVFDMTTGEVVEGPATEPVATYEVREEGDDLQIGV
jgi:3-phenylpropionate/trans-cinnamate dioxygenase ferredoxin subunit